MVAPEEPPPDWLALMPGMLLAFERVANEQSTEPLDALIREALLRCAKWRRPFAYTEAEARAWIAELCEAVRSESGPVWEALVARFPDAEARAALLAKIGAQEWLARA